MNILIITDYFAIGGNTTYIINARKALEKNGHHVVLITFKSTIESIDRWRFDTDHYDIFIKDFQFRYFISRVLRLYQLLSRVFLSWKPDIVISDLYLPAGALLVSRTFFPFLYSIPFFYQFHGSNTYEKKSGIEYRERHQDVLHSVKRRIHIFILSVFEKLVLNQATAIVIMSDYSRTLLHAMGVKNTVHKILPGGENVFRNISKTFSKKAAKHACAITEHKKMVLVISRLEPRKGVLHLLDALAAHRSFFLNTLVILCSQFDSYFGIEVLKNHSIHEFGNAIILINNPTLKDKALLYRAADAVLVPSLDLETFGFVALESYATGTPVVAYNVGAFDELIDHNWLVTPVGDGKKLLDRTQQLLSLPPQKLDAMSSSLIRYSQKFSWKSYTNSLILVAESYLKSS